LKDSNLKVEKVVSGLANTTSMAFLSKEDILVTEKDSGMVKRIVNGNIIPEPVLDLEVANIKETGLLGIAVTEKDNSNINDLPDVAYIYYTATNGSDGGVHIGNRLVKYNLIEDPTNGTLKMINPVLLLDLTPNLLYRHVGGKVMIDPVDKNIVYLTVGDYEANLTQANNNKDRPEPDGSGGILRIITNGTEKGILGDGHPLNKYYAYGIRNSFGIAFDPITKDLWDTENGPAFEDEINLVKPGFNSGWSKVMGLSTNKSVDWTSLVDFNGNGKYRDPEFVWNHTVGPTGIMFLESDKLGSYYENDLFVASSSRAQIYHFDLNVNRTGLILEGNLTDKIANAPGDDEGHIFGDSFYAPIELKTGPDGFLYVLDFNGTIYRIVPS
jgi:glucose/arabinose dehydrogenase